MIILEEIKKYRDVIDNGGNNSKVSEIADDLVEIQGQLLDLMHTAKNLMRQLEAIPEFHRTAQAALSYWYPHIRMAIDNEHEYLGNNTTIQDTINALNEEVEDDEE